MKRMLIAGKNEGRSQMLANVIDDADVLRYVAAQKNVFVKPFAYRLQPAIPKVDCHPPI